MQAEQVAVEVVGLHITDALEFVIRNQCTLRVVSVDGEFISEDIVPSRINVITKDDIVKVAFIG